MPDRVLNDHVIRFATFEVDLRAGELRKNGLKLRFGGQPLQVLSILLEQPGAVVTREEMQKRLWPDTFVDVDHNLNTAINKIREVLEEMNRVIPKMAKENEACQRLTEIPGVGPVTATALISAVGNGSTFQRAEI
jgi:DNA-binding response OmpR family regulator